MNLIEKLIRVDKETVEKKETKKIRSARLTKLLGEETEITIQEVSGRKHNDIMQMMFDEKGKRNISAAYDTNLMFCLKQNCGKIFWSRSIKMLQQSRIF